MARVANLQNLLQDKSTLYQWLEWSSQAIYMLGGILIGVVGIEIFMTPFDIAPTGFTGISVILNHFFDTPIGAIFLLLNVPVLGIGYRFLNGWGVIIRTIFVVLLYSLAFDVLAPIFPEDGVSENVLLNAIFGGVLSGISLALVLRGKGTFGSTSILALIIQRRTGTPLSTTYLYTDLSVVVGAGLIFGWESALYATITLFISGIVADYVLEGPSVIRVVMIVTKHPQTVSDVIMFKLERGVTALIGKGMYTGEERSLLYVTISRSQVAELRDLVSAVDEHAFIVVGQGHTAYGSGFRKHHIPPVISKVNHTDSSDGNDDVYSNNPST